MAEESDSEKPLAALGRVGFVGAGAVGSVLARVLAARGARVVAVATRHPERTAALAQRIPGLAVSASPDVVAATCDLVFLTVPDDAIAPLAASVAWAPGQAVVHCGGAHGASLLDAARARGVRTAALHPLMAFPQAMRDQPTERLLERISDHTWALEAADDAALAEALHTLVRALRGTVITLSAEARVPYHIAAVLASNDVVALLGAAGQLWESFGSSTDTALKALYPLLFDATQSLANVGLPGALTGPLARGDIGTIRAHLAWLDAHASTPGIADIKAAYVALARLTLPLAEAKGTLTPETATALRTLLDATRDNRP